MARPLRIDLEDGWYHVTARGIDRRMIFETDRDHGHFRELLGAMVERYGVILHAYVQMSNHYHLIIQTPNANLSKALQWLNVSYSVWFNRKHERVGPLFQGRFKSIPVENSSWAYELSLYVHLNPVMRKTYGLNKRAKQAESQGLRVPDREMVNRRLAALRKYPWSSYRVYGGYAKKPEWLELSTLLERAIKKKSKRQERYRRDMRERLSKGVSESGMEPVKDQFALGSEAFRSKVRKMGRLFRETAGKRNVRNRISIDVIISAVERMKSEPADAFLSTRGDWGRPLVLWGARQHTGMTLAEIGQAVDGADYSAVFMAIRRFEMRAKTNVNLRKRMHQLQGMLNVET